MDFSSGFSWHEQFRMRDLDRRRRLSCHDYPRAGMKRFFERQPAPAANG
jgi:hypothetical protein